MAKSASARAAFLSEGAATDPRALALFAIWLHHCDWLSQRARGDAPGLPPAAPAGCGDDGPEGTTQVMDALQDGGGLPPASAFDLRERSDGCGGADAGRDRSDACPADAADPPIEGTAASAAAAAAARVSGADAEEAVAREDAAPRLLLLPLLLLNPLTQSELN